MTSEEIERRMTALGYSQQKELATRLGCSQAAVHCWLAGKRRISWEYEEKIRRLAPQPGYREKYAALLAELEAEEQTRRAAGKPAAPPAPAVIAVPPTGTRP